MVSAGVSYYPPYANVSENFMLNITVGAPTVTGNISQIIVIDSSNPPFAVNYTSNWTGSIGSIFNGAIPRRMIWHNATAAGLVYNSTNAANQSFTIILNNTMAGSPSSYRLTVCLYNQTDITSFDTRVCNVSDPYFIEAVNITIGMNFGFSGYVKNDTGILQPNTNITIYDYITSAGGPPTEVPIKSALTDSDGLFSLKGINGSKSLYKIKLLYNNSVRATLVGPNLPPFPSNMFYSVPPPPEQIGMPMFKKMPVINGSIFYLQPAVTINVSAVGNVPAGNGTGKFVKFGYEVIDQVVGFPIESNVMSSNWNKEIVVPIGRSYTVMLARDPVTFGEGDWCFAGNTPLMNATACPSPPRSIEISSTNLSNEAGGQGGIINLTLNLSYSMQYLSGCLSLSGNSTLVNITKVITRLVPWEGFIPLMDAKIADFNATNNSNNLIYGDVRCTSYGTWSTFYNISLMGAGGSGIDYLMEFYAKNSSDEVSNGTVALAAFQNVTMLEANQWVNTTLYPLTGQYVLSSTLNTTKMKIFVQNSSGAALTTSMHVEVKVKHPVFGTMHYIIEDINNGIAYLPILNNSNWAKVSVYPNEAPPVEKTLNLNAIQNNVTVQVSEMTFRKPLTNGSLQSINTSVGAGDGTDASCITMSFYRNAAGCNTPNPPASCLLTQVNANDFNPMVVMMAGKVNLELKMNASNTTLYFINFDLLSAKPPTNSIMNNNASSASANAQSWEAGSFVPHVYDYAYVVMPYSVTPSDANYINESYTSFSMNIPHFKDENWVVVWNRTLGNTTAQLPDDYTDYNVGAYASLLTAAGTTCSTTNTTDVCYWDKGNNTFVLKVPHFSGVGSTIAGTAPTTTAATTDTAGSSTGGSISKPVSESRTFASVTADSENTYRLSDPDTIGINAVIFTATEDLESVRVTVSKLTSKPSSVSPDPEGGIYRYIEVDAPKLAGKTKEAKIQFEVTKTWLTDNDYAADDVILMRFADNKWNALTTSKLSESSNKAYYEATSPGFSYFAITAQKEAEEDPIVEEATNLTSDLEVAPIAAAVEEQTSKVSLKALWITIGVLLVLLLAVFGYRKKHLLIFWREPTDKERQNIIRGEFLSRKKEQSWGSGKDD